MSTWSKCFALDTKVTLACCRPWVFSSPKSWRWRNHRQQASSDVSLQLCWWILRLSESLFSELPSAPNLLRATKFSVPVHELDTIMPAGWSLNTFKTSTTCRLQPGKPVELALLERRKVFYDHSRCLHCQGGNGAPVACKDVVQRIVYGSTLLKVSFYRERNKEAQKKPKERTRLTWAKPRVVNK